MRINGNEKYYGYTLFQIRKLLRAGRDYPIGIEETKFILKIGINKARIILKQLEKDKYLESCMIHRNKVYVLTLKGGSLALASAANPINRNTAERLIEGFLGRVKIVNEEDAFLYSVKKVLLFGSMLTDIDKVSDVDLYVELTPKHSIKDLQIINDKAVRDEIQNGRSFSNSTEKMAWSENKVFRFLKARSGYLSIHSENDEIINHVESKILFEVDTNPLI